MKTLPRQPKIQTRGPFHCKTCGVFFSQQHPQCEKCRNYICPSCSLHANQDDPNHCTVCNESTLWVDVHED